MSKQHGYEPQRTAVSYGEDYYGSNYGFAARLPQAGGSQQTDEYLDFDDKGAGTSRVAPTMQYPSAAYADAPVTGYPAISMAGPLGMVVQDPLGGRCSRKRALRRASLAGDAIRCRHCGGCRRHKGGPVHLLFRLARSAFHTAQGYRRSQLPSPATKAGFGA